MRDYVEFYTICPVCEKNYNEATKKKQLELQNDYGNIPKEEYDEKLLKLSKQEEFTEENLSVVVNVDFKGEILHLRYYSRCIICSFLYKKKFEIDVFTDKINYF